MPLDTISSVVPDTQDARLVFTATIAGNGVTPANHMGLWSVSPLGDVTLLLRTGGSIDIGAGHSVQVASFDALRSPTGTRGQGRSTDAGGFVTAVVRLAAPDSRMGVLRIPLP